MTDHDRVALRFFHNLMQLWGCTPDRQHQLLGCSNSAELKRWQARGLPHDALLRISHLMGIHRALRTIFGDNPAAYGWVSRPNEAPPFAGRAALELLVEGRFVEVREYLERQLSVLPETEELAASAEKIRAVMFGLKGGSRRQRMAPPPGWDD